MDGWMDGLLGQNNHTSSKSNLNFRLRYEFDWYNRWCMWFLHTVLEPSSVRQKTKTNPKGWFVIAWLQSYRCNLLTCVFINAMPWPIYWILRTENLSDIQQFTISRLVFYTRRYSTRHLSHSDKSAFTPHDRKQILNSLTKNAITAMLPTSGHFDGLGRNLSLQLRKFSHSLLRVRVNRSTSM